MEANSFLNFIYKILVIIILFLSLFFSGFFTTSYAVTTIDDLHADYICQNGLTNDFGGSQSGTIIHNFWLSSNLNDYATFPFNTEQLKPLFIEKFNTYNDIDFNYKYLDFLGWWFMYKYNGNYYIVFYYTNANMGTGDSYYPYLYFKSTHTSTEYQLNITFINENHEFVAQNLNRLTFIVDTNGNFSFDSFGKTTTITSNFNYNFRMLTAQGWNVGNQNSTLLSPLIRINWFFKY